MIKVRVTKAIRWLIYPYKMCEIPKIPKIYDYNRDKMRIIQNEVVWNQNTGGGISLCSEFRYHSENFSMIAFAIIAKIQGIGKIQIFSMHSNFRYDSEISLS